MYFVHDLIVQDAKSLQDSIRITSSIIEERRFFGSAKPFYNVHVFNGNYQLAVFSVSQRKTSILVDNDIAGSHIVSIIYNDKQIFIPCDLNERSDMSFYMSRNNTDLFLVVKASINRPVNIFKAFAISKGIITSTTEIRTNDDDYAELKKIQNGNVGLFTGQIEVDTSGTTRTSHLVKEYSCVE